MNEQPTPVQGVILFAHGSRDPLWRLPMEAVAARMLARFPGRAVRCAYLELTAPDLPTAADELVASGVRSVTIVPMFLGVGRHVREDLPALVAQLRERHAGVQWLLQRPVGEEDRLLDLLAELAAGGGD
ncbi:MAG TPA: CbiX/SirB N-terminal domain-containing protein [Ramlibacter sp.]|nr:CbiX/SirB N-terminal domain-containing protein [Ramlibacter sp.]